MIYRDPKDNEFRDEPSWPFILMMMLVFASPFIALAAIVILAWIAAP